MLLWIEHAKIDVVLWASRVSMLPAMPILIVPPGLAFWAWASDGRPRGAGPASPTAGQPSALRTGRRLTSSRSSSLTTSNPSRLFMVSSFGGVHFPVASRARQRTRARRSVVEMAGHRAARLGFPQLGFHLRTAIEAMRAAASEAAPAWQVDRARQLALEEPGRLIEDRRAAVADRRDRRHQGLGVGMERALEQLAGG